LIINYELVRSNRKSIGITIERDAGVLVNAPIDLNDEEIEKQIYKKRLWIWGKLALKNVNLENIVQKQFVSGESFSYLGRHYRLQIIDDNSDLKLKNGLVYTWTKKAKESKRDF
jgi:predicted metal-dependent hydrolase